MRAEIKKQAKKLGIPLDVVADTYRELRAYERQARDWEWTIRRRVWEMYSYSPESNEFWRHGMHVRYARAFGEGDRTLIPRWDETADELAMEFPELAVDGDPAERLFEFIARRYEPLPTAEDTWKQAVDVCLERVAEWAVDAEPVPF
ncbi:MAG: hypothetical protein A3E01_10840 [Gammaproteobacteria bacterium RIFCSPHIGHO2_12_FULL_63_22]|nr:MAG: hypothetical protein A3E01_10840 [Gammaproteobacteria bacterium RIFCSPHIGHO2_12_FULL_63_22]